MIFDAHLDLSMAVTLCHSFEDWCIITVLHVRWGAVVYGDVLEHGVLVGGESDECLGLGNHMLIPAVALREAQRSRPRNGVVANEVPESDIR